MKVIAVANQKGGVGKTSTCVNLAAALGKLGKKVLVLDMDPQGNTTSGLGIERSTLKWSIYDVLLNSISISRACLQTNWENVTVVPTIIDLAAAEVELSSAISRESRLRRSLEQETEYYCALIDCPPSLGLLTLNSLVAANSLLVPIQCEYYALEGLSQLMKTIDLVRSYLNSTLELEGLLLTMFDSRTRLSKEVADEVRSRFGNKVYQTAIPRNVKISEAPSFGMPAIYYDSTSIGAVAYTSLAEEVVQKWEKLER